MKKKVRAAKKESPEHGSASAERSDLPDSLHVGYGVARLARLIARDATRRLGDEIGLTLAEWRILLLIGAESKVPLDLLADRALLEKSHASIAAAALVRSGLLLRSSSPGDLRRILFTRTARGAQVVLSYLAATAAERRALWGVLSAGEQATLGALVARLLAVAEQQPASRGRRSVRRNAKV